MRISNQISILHVVGVAGAVGLSIATALLMRVSESAANEAARVANEDARLGALVVDGYELIELVEAFTGDASEEPLVLAGRVADRWRGDVARLESTGMGRSRAMARTTEALAGMSSVASDPGLHDGERVEAFMDRATAFVAGLRELEAISQQRVNEANARHDERRRLVMVGIGVMCLGFLLVVEHLRYWTTKRLVRPMERLARAAMGAMDEDAPLAHLGSCGTVELNDLTRSLSRFVESLKGKVDERTAELERQKEDLEHEVSVRRRAEEQLRHAALHDRLTGLCNRELLWDRIDRCIDRARRNPDYMYAVLFLDIDRFKEVNDSHGHTLGDQFLITIANRLQTCLRKTDAVSKTDGSTIARIGGDEFVVLLDGVRGPEDAVSVAERVQETLATPIVLEGIEFFTSASIGIATSELAYRSPDDLLRDADAAMYSAKAAGKARHELFNETMHAEVKARLQLGNDLRRAVDNEEFRAYYQPVCRLETGELVGFETLIRWQHPARGLVSPGEFIEHSEETGLVVELGAWVLNEACRQLREWHDRFPREGEPLSVSVNVSMRQACRDELVDEVREALERHGIPASSLKLEITESVVMGDGETIAHVLSELKALGVEIHMDDFGTGYSSLSYLHRFPLDALKIDRTFLTTARDESDYAGIVRTVVALAHQLDMSVAIEGVETPEQCAALRSIGADLAQGYYFSRPLEAGAATELLEHGADWKLEVAA